MSMNLNGHSILIAGDRESVEALAAPLEHQGAKIRLITDLAGFANYLKIGEVFHSFILCAPPAQARPFLETRPEDWQEGMKHTIERLTLALQSAARHLIRSQVPGQIIVVSSAVALKPYRNFSLSGTTLAALHAIARISAVDLAAHGIRVNVIAAGLPPLTLDETDLSAFIPTGRLTALMDVAQACAFLASESAAQITGAIIPVDGGYSITKAGAATVKPGS